MIYSKYPALSTVVDRLLDIYFLLSAGKHSGADDVAMETDAENVGKFLSHDGRQISTRWLCYAHFHARIQRGGPGVRTPPLNLKILPKKR